MEDFHCSFIHPTSTIKVTSVQQTFPTTDILKAHLSQWIIINSWDGFGPSSLDSEVLSIGSSAS